MASSGDQHEQTYSDPPNMPIDERMTDAELHTVREWLGFTGDALASWLDVPSRTLRRWEAGKYPIPDGVRLEVEDLEQRTAAFLNALLPQVKADPDPILVTYRFDQDFHQANPDMQAFPAAWHRRVCMRIAQEVPGVSIVYSDTL